MFMFDLVKLNNNLSKSKGIKDLLINTFCFALGFVINFATAFIFIGLPVYFGLVLFSIGG